MTIKPTTTHLYSGPYSIDILHDDSDPSTWIVRQYRHYFGFRKRISSNWFNDKEQAVGFAERQQHNKVKSTAVGNLEG